MKKIVMLVLVGLVAGTGYAQGLLLNRNRTSPAEAKFIKENPTGTNEFGRTWKAQCAYEKFMKEHPDGKNKFGKTFEEQQSFDMKSFLGFKFGEHCCMYTQACEAESEGDRDAIYTVKLAKPFRMFDRVLLGATVKRRLAMINASKELEVVTQESLSNEVDKLVALFEKQYNVEFLYSSRDWFSFMNEQVQIFIGYDWYEDKSSGAVEFTIVKENMYLPDKELRLKEKQKMSKGFDIPADEGLNLMDATTPNVATNATTIVKPRAPSSRNGTSFRPLRERQLERRRLREKEVEMLREKEVVEAAERAKVEAEREQLRQQLAQIREEEKKAWEAEQEKTEKEDQLGIGERAKVLLAQVNSMAEIQKELDALNLNKADFKKEFGAFLMEVEDWKKVTENLQKKSKVFRSKAEEMKNKSEDLQGRVKALDAK